MTTTTMGAAAARPAAERNQFLVFIALVWVGVLSGFGVDSFDHVSKHGLDYPLIVHFHAVAFVGWLVLFTVQASLIRTNRVALHRKLGLYAVALAGVMVVLGPATAIVADAAAYTAHGETPEFLGVQFTDILAFATLSGVGLLLRRNSPAHKRLMLLGLLYISDAGFARFLNGFAAAPLGQGFWGEMTGLYLGSDLLIIGFGVYDLIVRRRLHQAYVIGAVWVLLVQLTGQSLLHNSAWKAFTLHLIGH